MKDNTAAVHAQVPVDVATFLLNEKRTDVQAVELRHKVTILLIPNIHLETPQHTSCAFAMTKLAQEELQQASYRMVALPHRPSRAWVVTPRNHRPRQRATRRRKSANPAKRAARAQSRRPAKRSSPATPQLFVTLQPRAIRQRPASLVASAANADPPP
jgi:ribonuclease E